MPNKERTRYIVVIVNTDKTLKSVFTGYFTECIDAANYLIDKYKVSKDKIVFISDSTHEIINTKHLMKKFYYRDFGSFGKETRLKLPWER